FVLFRQKTAYEVRSCPGFRRLLFRSPPARRRHPADIPAAVDIRAVFRMRAVALRILPRTRAAALRILPRTWAAAGHILRLIPVAAGRIFLPISVAARRILPPSVEPADRISRHMSVAVACRILHRMPG